MASGNQTSLQQPGKSPVSFILEICARKGLSQPDYEEKSQGQDHMPKFTCRAIMKNIASDVATSRKKNVAKQSAVKNLLEKIVSSGRHEEFGIGATRGEAEDKVRKLVVPDEGKIVSDGGAATGAMPSTMPKASAALMPPAKSAPLPAAAASASSPVTSSRKSTENTIAPTPVMPKASPALVPPAKSTTGNSPSAKSAPLPAASSAVTSSRKSTENAAAKNSVVRLKEMCDKLGWPQPDYKPAPEIGSPPMQEFIVKVDLGNLNMEGKGSSKGLAKQNAADELLASLSKLTLQPEELAKFIDALGISIQHRESSIVEASCVSKQLTGLAVSSKLSQSTVKKERPTASLTLSSDRTNDVAKNNTAGSGASSYKPFRKVILCEKYPTCLPQKSYKNDSKLKGLAIIFNNEIFEKSSENSSGKTKTLLDPNLWRAGTDKDCADMKDTLEQIGYKVRVQQDLTANEMRSAIRVFANDPTHKHMDSTVVVIMSHGAQEKILAKDRSMVHKKDFFDALNGENCKALEGKPKIFFIQACRDNARFSKPSTIKTDSVVKPKIIPIQRDFFVLQSSTAGAVSYRDDLKGSFFIQTLCDVLAAYAHEHSLYDLGMEVKRRVGEEDIPINDETDEVTCGEAQIKKQMPEGSSDTLVKHFFFYPGLPK